jgi:hypothetical protein
MRRFCTARTPNNECKFSVTLYQRDKDTRYYSIIFINCFEWATK